jgi:hypothetical protein
MKWKYREQKDKRVQRVYHPDDLVFTIYRVGGVPRLLYDKICKEFNKLQDTAGLTEKKDGSIRRKYTLHSFRRFVKTVSNISSSYSEWALGHAKSTYWVKTPEEKTEEYLKVMKYLTYLNYEALEARGKERDSWR